MSIYFDSTKDLFVVRSYIEGVFAYIGTYKTREEAEKADSEWKDDPRLHRKDGIIHTSRWFDNEKRKQAQLYKNYPPYAQQRKGK